MPADPIKIVGLSQFVRNLKKLDGDLPKAVRLALNEAAEVIVKDARARVPKRSGRAQRSIRKASTRDRVRVKAGGARAPYYPWLDFGGTITPHATRGSIKRPFYKEGRYLYKAYFDRSRAGDFQSTMTDALLGVVRQAGIEVD